VDAPHLVGESRRLADRSRSVAPTNALLASTARPLMFIS